MLAVDIGIVRGHIAKFCNQEDLPGLTSLVVRKTRGLPGDGIPVQRDLDQERQKAYEYPWYKVVPPSEEDLAAAWEAAKK